jgi:hypothetical protein
MYQGISKILSFVVLQSFLFFVLCFSIKRCVVLGQEECMYNLCYAYSCCFFSRNITCGHFFFSYIKYSVTVWSIPIRGNYHNKILLLIYV